MSKLEDEIIAKFLSRGTMIIEGASPEEYKSLVEGLKNFFKETPISSVQLDFLKVSQRKLEKKLKGVNYMFLYNFDSCGSDINSKETTNKMIKLREYHRLEGIRELILARPHANLAETCVNHPLGNWGGQVFYRIEDGKLNTNALYFPSYNH